MCDKGEVTWPNLWFVWGCGWFKRQRENFCHLCLVAGSIEATGPVLGGSRYLCCAGTRVPVPLKTGIMEIDARTSRISAFGLRGGRHCEEITFQPSAKTK